MTIRDISRTISTVNYATYTIREFGCPNDFRYKKFALQRNTRSYERCRSFLLPLHQTLALVLLSIGTLFYYEVRL